MAQGLIGRTSLVLAVAVFGTIVGLSGLVAPRLAAALSGSDFQAGRIIDDQIFFQSTSLGNADIQTFLNARVPVCDTNGTQPYPGYANRAAYGTLNGSPPPYICLKDYKQDIPSAPADAYCSGTIGAGSAISSAQIIYEVARACGISPKVLIVLLQKEQGLVTDDWPWPVQYQKATGYGCPDTAPCDAQYYGFFNQVYNAAHQFQRYAKQSQNFNYRSGMTSFVAYQANNPGCGGTNVAIQNQATANLYNYTPYQPNQAALNNLYGTGDSCSAYGNRNFWRIFSDWFGSPIYACGSNETAMPQVVSMYNPKTYDHFYTAYRCEAEVLGFLQGYTYEGAVFNTTSVNPSGVPVWRLYNPALGLHLWTTTQDDINNALKLGYNVEGIAFYTVPPNAPNVYRVVQRLYNPKTYQHLWTMSQEVINLVTQSAGYVYEGPAFYSQ